MHSCAVINFYKGWDIMEDVLSFDFRWGQRSFYVTIIFVLFVIPEDKTFM